MSCKYAASLQLNEKSKLNRAVLCSLSTDGQGILDSFLRCESRDGHFRHLAGSLRRLLR